MADDTINYLWQQVDGETVEMNISDSGDLTFDLPEVTSNSSVAFELIIDNGRNQSLAATATVLLEAVSTPITPPATEIPPNEEQSKSSGSTSLIMLLTLVLFSLMRIRRKSQN